MQALWAGMQAALAAALEDRRAALGDASEARAQQVRGTSHAAGMNAVSSCCSHSL